MKLSRQFLFRFVAVIQICIAAFLAFNSFIASAADSRDVDDFARYERSSEKMDKPQADSSLQRQRITWLAKNAAVLHARFDYTVLMASLVFLGLGGIQLWMIAKSTTVADALRD